MSRFSAEFASNDGFFVFGKASDSDNLVQHCSQPIKPPRGRDFIAPCKCKGTSKYVHRECLDHWRAIKEGFAFAHCTTCKAPYYLRVHVIADRKWRTMKFRFFVTRDILFIFFAVQLVIAVLAYSMYLIDDIRNFGFVSPGVSTANLVSTTYVCRGTVIFRVAWIIGVLHNLL
ncbi:hypothetical protein ACP275_12G005300 [Erythranthe tilingii]